MTGDDLNALSGTWPCRGRQRLGRVGAGWGGRLPVQV